MYSNPTVLLSGDYSILMQYALSSILVLILLLLVVDKTLGIKPSDAEPHFLPSGVPYFGHVIGIIRRGVDYYDEMTQVNFDTT